MKNDDYNQCGDRQIIAIQIVFAALDLAVEMCTRPWIVELSNKSPITFEVIETRIV